jgi:D-alanyl-lipoteichoic acid acyltransferase DltB (MBOAT superfamily)
VGLFFPFSGKNRDLGLSLYNAAILSLFDNDTNHNIELVIVDSKDGPSEPSKSIAEFWRRWHISLSEWLRDYVYYPLALSGKKSQSKLYIATIITFLLSGLWHGAAWHYVLMGFYFGSCIVLAELTKGIRKAFFGKLTSSYGRIFRYTNQVLTFMLVCIGWVFF